MANPFEVQTLNPLQALLVGNQAYDASKKSYQQEQQKNVLASLLGGGMSGGNPSGVPDYGRAASTLAAGGDLDGAVKIATLGKAFSPESTPDIQNFNFAVKNGFKGSILDFAKEKAAAGATKISNNTNVNTGEKAYDQTLGKSYGERFGETQKAGRDAAGALGNLDTMEKLISNPNFYSGTGGEAATTLKRMAVSAGIAGADTAAPNELFQKLSQKSVLDAAGGSLGTGFSNADRDYLNGTVANIKNTPEGNRQIIQIGRQVQQRNVEIAKLARDYAKAHGGRIDSGFDEQVAGYAEKNPLFAGVGGTRSAAPQQPQASPRQAADGNYYVPDPNRPGKYLQVVQ